MRVRASTSSLACNAVNCQHSSLSRWCGRTTDNKKLSYRRDGAGRRWLRRSRSVKITDFGTNRKPVRDFLLVNNTKLHPISHRSQVIADYWSNMHFRQGNVALFNTLVQRWIPKLTTKTFCLETLETSLCRRPMVWNVFRCLEPFRRGSRAWRTDRQNRR